MKKSLIYLVGIVFLLLGIYFSVFQEEPHFYAFFSIGVFLILFQIYNSISKIHLFNKWKLKEYLLFLIILIVVCIIIDKIGISFGYWKYQYSTLFDEVIKYLFEWVVAFLYFMFVLLIGMNILIRIKLNKKLSFILSLFIFVSLAGLVTEYINHFSNSWIILKMPFSNYKIGNFFVIFQTIGYWLIALIPLGLYKFINKIK